MALKDFQRKAGKGLRALSYYLIHEKLNLISSTQGFHSSDLMHHVTTTEMN